MLSILSVVMPSIKLKFGFQGSFRGVAVRWIACSARTMMGMGINLRLCQNVDFTEGKR